jgi:hypothetical protein
MIVVGCDRLLFGLVPSKHREPVSIVISRKQSQSIVGLRETVCFVVTVLATYPADVVKASSRSVL